MCDRWRDSFEAFLEDVGPRPSPEHSIDRINNDGPYEPGNVRWATKKEQDRNKRQTHLIEYKGETHCITEWAEILGMNRKTLFSRINERGWSVERAFTEPTLRRS